MNLNLQELHEYVSLVKDIVTTLSAVTVAGIAILGLQTWKKQLKGKTEYELARRLLRTVYKVRDAIRLVRNPIMGAGEISQALQENNIEVDQHDERFDAISQRSVYQRRLDKVQDALTELALDVFEAEAIWGQGIREKLEPLRKSVLTLFADIMLYLEQIEEPDRHILDRETAHKIRGVIYECSEDPSKDSFTAEIIEAIKQVEDYLRPHLNL